MLQSCELECKHCVETSVYSDVTVYQQQVEPFQVLLGQREWTHEGRSGATEWSSSTLSECNRL